MPKPVGEGQKYLPGLDGLRALAVAVVIAYHLGLGWAGGGLLGVGVFFTLSGYLITDILLSQWRKHGRLDLKDFWIRRARRLLPALFVVLAVVAAWVAIAYPSQVPAVRGGIVAAALYVSNWWFITQNGSYFARFGPPSPVSHLWSLAVEEQFYLLWPWVVLTGGLLLHRLLRLPRAHARAVALGVTLAAATASFVALALLYHPGLDPTRTYEGTDTRAGGLLIGAALAIILPTRRARRASAANATGGDPVTATHTPNATGRLLRRTLDLAGLAGLAGIALLIWRTDEYSAVMFRGGMELLSLCTALVIAAVVTPGTLTARALGIGPLRWLGVRSYGIYLWHYPVIVLAAAGGNPDGTTPSGLRQVLTAGACVAVAALSWALVEDPIRSRRRPRLPGWVRSAAGWARKGWAQAVTASAMALAVAAGAAFGALIVSGGLRPAAQSRGLLAGSTVSGETTSGSSARGSGDTAPAGGSGGLNAGSGGTGTSAGGRSRAGGPGTGGPVSSAPAALWFTSPGASPLGPSVAAAQAVADAGVAGPGAAYTASLPQARPRTSCQSVVHIGDSTSDGLISSAYLPNAAQRIPARYAAVGVRNVHMEVVGATSIVEEYEGHPNAYKVAERYRASGYNGCWVIALGTNDTADVAVGSNVGLAERIKRMMSVIGDQPVLWITVKSLLSSGPYSEHDMSQWDQALAAAEGKYPNMRVYDWASVVQDQWFINDKIHYTSAGYAARGELIADALAAAFPASTALPAGAASPAGTVSPG
jgi:peptidoglycan/LPS O-acetylase OafA/YrhL